jgi:hypothetical protein
MPVSKALQRKPGFHHPALLLLEGRSGVWHALSLSVSQQLVGPVRLCADLRYALRSQALHPNASEALPGNSTRLQNGRTRESEAALPSPCDSELPSTSGPQYGRLSGTVRQITSLRPSLFEASYGLDVCLPMLSGLARLALWYSPTKKEGLLELRLF